MENQPFLSLGMMSGTSMDGIDAALLETDGSPQHIREIGHGSAAYPPPFRTLLKAAEYSIKKRAEEAIAVNTPDVDAILNNAQKNFLIDLQGYLRHELKLEESDINPTLQELSSYLYPDHAKVPITLNAIIEHSTGLHAKLAEELLQKAGKSPQDVDVVGCHGQAFFHRPAAGVSIVLNNGKQLAHHLGITVVNDFRSNDVKAGGQGAPFAPLYHQALAMSDQKIPCAVINCGGIANVTFVTSDKATDLLGFDTGPGNGLIDRFVRQRTHGRENMDKDGRYGRRGIVNDEVLKLLYEKSLIKEAKNYFSMKPPKSLDIGDMTLIPELDQLSLEDGCATLEAFTADTIVHSLTFMKNPDLIPQNWILAGGGWHNPVIRKQFELKLKQRVQGDVKVYLADEVGWNSQALEAQIFAYLAVRSLQNMPLSVPGTTGVACPLSGGAIFVPTTGATKKVQEFLYKA